MTQFISLDSVQPEPTQDLPAPPLNSQEETTYRLHRRFDRLGRMYGDGAVEHLMNSKVVVFGLGGVGSWAAESLARSALGHIMLVDFDDVCVTNANRQLQALKGNIGKPKSDILAERLKLVNPQAKIEGRRQFYKEEHSDELLTPPWGGDYDFVVDCVDNMTAKAHLLATCVERGIPVVSSMGAAGKLDISSIRTSDLSETTVCRMARELRKILRRKHGFLEKTSFSIPSVYSVEQRRWPRELSYDEGKGFKCVCPNFSPDHGCDSRSLIDGTVSFVTGAFGLHMASHVVNTLVASWLEEAGDAQPAQDRFGYKPD